MPQRERPDFIPPEMWPPNSSDLNPVDYSIWGILQERVYRSRIHDVKELRERLLREWRLLDHTIITAAIAQWRSRLNACVRVNGGHFEHTFFEPLTFCCFMCFIDRLLLLVYVSVIDINMCKVLILCEMCYFCVWHFHMVPYSSNITNMWQEILTLMTLAFSCEVVHEILWKSVNICKSYGEKNSGTLLCGHRV